MCIQCASNEQAMCIQCAVEARPAGTTLTDALLQQQSTVNAAPSPTWIGSWGHLEGPRSYPCAAAMARARVRTEQPRAVLRIATELTVALPFVAPGGIQGVHAADGPVLVGCRSLPWAVPSNPTPTPRINVHRDYAVSPRVPPRMPPRVPPRMPPPMSPTMPPLMLPPQTLAHMP